MLNLPNNPASNIISLAKDLIPNAELKEKEVEHLHAALKLDTEISDRIVDILKEQPTVKSDQWRQLRDITLYLHLLDNRLSRDPSVEKDPLNHFKSVAARIDHVVNQSEEEHAHPSWQTLMDQMEKLVKEGQKLHPPSEKSDFMENRKAKTIEDKVFAQIHGDAFISDTGLEGNSQLYMLHVLIQYLEEKETLNPKEKEFLRMLRETRGLCTKLPGLSLKSLTTEELAEAKKIYCDGLKEQVQNLKIGESVLIPTGWGNIYGGHAMYMQVTRGKILH